MGEGSNLRFAVTYNPKNDAIDRAYAKDRALQVAREWGEAMQSGSEIRDFVGGRRRADKGHRSGQSDT